MARTWSNNKITDTTSAAQRARQNQSRVNPFTVVLAVIALLFLSMTLYTAYHAVTHPPTQRYAPPDEKQ